MTSYEIPDGPKMLRETLCVAQTRIARWAGKDDGHACADNGCGCGWEPVGMRWPPSLIRIAAFAEDQTEGRKDEHIARLGRLIDECDRKRPLGPDGKHGRLHTDECGCEDKS